MFESGAILLYLAQTYGPAREPKQLGADMSWVVWANSELDPLCFGKGMRYRGLPTLDRLPRRHFCFTMQPETLLDPPNRPPFFIHVAALNWTSRTAPSARWSNSSGR